VNQQTDARRGIESLRQTFHVRSASRYGYAVALNLRLQAESLDETAQSPALSLPASAVHKRYVSMLSRR